ncbi:hypothetical protein BOX15_Mlig002078g1, partial [Macrostomum lignano]
SELQLVKDVEAFVASLESSLQQQPAAPPALLSDKVHERQRKRLDEELAVCCKVAELLASTGQSLEEQRAAETDKRWAAEATSRDLRLAAEKLEAKELEARAAIEAAQAELDRRRAERRHRVDKLQQKVLLFEAATGVRFDDNNAESGDETGGKWRGRLLGRTGSAGDVPFCLDANGDRDGSAAREALWRLMRPRGDWADLLGER